MSLLAAVLSVLTVPAEAGSPHTSTPEEEEAEEEGHQPAPAPAPVTDGVED